MITYPTDITSTVGVKEVTVQYTDVTGTKRYTSFNITVEAAEPVIEKGSVALFTLPASIVDYNDKVDKAKNPSTAVIRSKANTLTMRITFIT